MELENGLVEHEIATAYHTAGGGTSLTTRAKTKVREPTTANVATGTQRAVSVHPKMSAQKTEL